MLGIAGKTFTVKVQMKSMNTAADKAAALAEDSFLDGIHETGIAACLRFGPVENIFIFSVTSACEKAWLAVRVSLRQARQLCTASSAQRSRRLRSTRAAVPFLLAHAQHTGP